MKKRLIALSLITIFSIGLIGCGSTKVEEKKPVVEDKAPAKEEKDEPSQAELDTKLKEEATQANFVEINGDKANGKKIWIEGQISNVNLNSFPITFSISQKEGDGLGLYNVSYINTNKPELKDGDKLKIYGVVSDRDASGMPTIGATIIEK